MRKRGPYQTSRLGYSRSSPWFAKQTQKRRRRNKIAHESRRKNAQLKKGRK